MEVIRIKEVKFAESVWCGPGEVVDAINEKRPHLKAYLYQNLLWIYHETHDKWYGTSTANLRHLSPIDIPSELANEIRCFNSGTRNDQTSEPKTAIKDHPKPRVRGTK